MASDKVSFFQRRKKLFVLICVAAVVGLAVGLMHHRARFTPRKLRSMLQNTEKILLIHGHSINVQKAIFLDDEKEITEFIGELQFTRKPPCECSAYNEYIEFHTKSGVLKAVFNDHNLSIWEEGKGSLRLKMPKKLWQLYQTHRARVTKIPQSPF